MSRPRTRPRQPQGAHLATLRKAAGLSQTEFARLLGVPQSSVAFWETIAKPPRSDVLPKMAEVLGVTVEEILNPTHVRRARPGPVGKVQRAFENVSRLPRAQQEKILEVLDALISQFSRSA